MSRGDLTPRPDARRRAARAIVIGIAALTLVAMAAACWIGIRGSIARDRLLAARSDASAAIGAIDTDVTAAKPALAAMSSKVNDAVSLTSDPVWRAAQHLPWLGPQLEAVSTLASAAAEVVDDAIPPLVDALATTPLTALTPHGGRLDLPAISSLAAPARTAADAAAAAAARVAGLDREVLVGPVGSAFDEASGFLTETASGLDAVARTTALLPRMLGADGPRFYVVVVQNNAEWRSLGGNTGVAILVRAEGGRLSFVRSATAGQLTQAPGTLDVSLSASDAAVFANRPTTYFQNATQIPDFTTDGPLIAAYWHRFDGTAIDGVVALDPVVLSYLLRATGPVSLATGETVTAENAVSLLLNEVYFRYSAGQEDGFFAAAAESIFQALTTDATDARALLEALGRAGDERRVYVWNARPDEQAVLAGSSIEGRQQPSDAATTRVGVYLNDATASKMDYYMRAGATSQMCGDEARLAVQLRSDAPADASTLPAYVSGGGIYGVPAGTARTVAYIYLPASLTVTAVRMSTPDRYVLIPIEGYTVLMWTSDLLPGASTSLDISFSGAAPRVETFVTPTLGDILRPGFADSCGAPE